jgi:endonuclease/exonuclease/phosphatase family metal-dependent hydrolase
MPSETGNPHANLQATMPICATPNETTFRFLHISFLSLRKTIHLLYIPMLNLMLMPKSKLFTALLLIILSVDFASPLSAAPLKTMSWNIEWFPGNRPNSNNEEQGKQIKAASEIIAKQSPDILLAQEISNQQSFDKLFTDTPDIKTNVISRFMEDDGKTPSPQQCAIASKLKAHSAWFETFKPSDNLPSLRRGFAFAALEHPSGGLIMIYCVHLKSNRGSDTPEGEKNVADTRAESVKQILAHKTEMEKKFADHKILGWIVGGDLNTNHDNQFTLCTVLADFKKAGFQNTWENTPKENRQTWRTPPYLKQFNPTTFDYLLTHGFKKTEALLVPDVPVEVSDHAPLYINLATE